MPFAERVRREAGVMSMAVGIIVDPAFAENILQKGQADLIAIGREALVNACWPQMAEIALGRKAVEAMDDWPVAVRLVAQASRVGDRAHPRRGGGDAKWGSEGDAVMKLMMFEKGNGAALGLVEGSALVDLAAADATLPKDLHALMPAGPGR